MLTPTRRPILPVLALAAVIILAGTTGLLPTVGAQGIGGNDTGGNDTGDGGIGGGDDTPQGPEDPGTPHLAKAVANRDADGTLSTHAWAEPGETIEVELTYTSRNGSTTNITVQDRVPEHTELVTCSGGCAAEAGDGPGTDLVWSYENASDNQTFQETVELRVLTDAPTSGTDVGAPATVTTNQTFGSTASNDVHLTVTRPTTPLDLAVRNTADDLASGYADSYLVRAGDPLTYRLTYENTGDQAIENLTLATLVPDHAEMAACSDNCSTDGDDGPGTNVTWSIGDLGAGQATNTTVDLALNASFPDGTTTLTVPAVASYINETGNRTNRSTTLSLTATASTNASLTLSVAPAAASGDGAKTLDTEPGTNLTYTLTYENSGNATAAGVTLEDAVVDNATLTGCPDPCKPNGDGGPETQLRWRLGNVTGGSDPTVVTFSVRLDATFPPGTTIISNTAKATSDGADPIRSDRVEVNVTGEGSPGPSDTTCPEPQDDQSGNATGNRTAPSGNESQSDAASCPEAQADEAPPGNQTGEPADLVVENLTVDPALPNVGETLTVKLTVTNQGGGVETPVRLSVRIDGDEVTHEVLQGMAAGSSQELAIETGWQATQGGHELAVIVDSDEAVEESDELNNAVTTTLDVGASLQQTSRPDGNATDPADAGEDEGSALGTPGPGLLAGLAAAGLAAGLATDRRRP